MMEKKKRVFTRLGYSALETAEIVSALNNLLANYSVHYQKLRNFHWNVKGSDFFDIHEKFELQYNDAQLAIDEIAERVRIFGQRPFSTLNEYLTHSIILEVQTELKADEMVQEVLADYRILLEKLFDVIDISLEHGDSGTEDLAKGLVKQMEKNHWMMTAFSIK